MEDRFVNIELKLVAMEDLVESLNDTVYAQSERIGQLELAILKLADQLRMVNVQGPQTALNERPPHY